MITTNEEILRTKSEDWKGTPEQLESLISILDYELKTCPVGKGAGLSAIQVNIPFKVAILRSKNTKIDVYNPEIISTSQPFVFKNEGCLSIPNFYCDTNRYNIVVFKNGDGKEYKLSGFDSILFLHEHDHFNGILFTEHKINEKS